MANSVDPDQTAPIGEVCSGSTLFDSILNLSVMLGNCFSRQHFHMHFFLGALRVKKNIPWDKCLAFWCDSASVMTGRNKGVIAFIREQLPHIFLQGCPCHLVHLAAEKASRQLQISRDMRFPTMWYVRPAKAQISLRIWAV